MTTDKLKDALMKKISEKTEAILLKKAQTLTALIQYEIAVANTELAMSSAVHGYDFQFIPESYADAVIIGQAQSGGGQMKMTITIPAHAFKNASENEVAFFKTYILANALTKLRGGI